MLVAGLFQTTSSPRPPPSKTQTHWFNFFCDSVPRRNGSKDTKKARASRFDLMINFRTKIMKFLVKWKVFHKCNTGYLFILFADFCCNWTGVPEKHAVSSCRQTPLPLLGFLFGVQRFQYLEWMPMAANLRWMQLVPRPTNLLALLHSLAGPHIGAGTDNYKLVGICRAFVVIGSCIGANYMFIYLNSCAEKGLQLHPRVKKFCRRRGIYLLHTNVFLGGCATSLPTTIITRFSWSNALA